MNLIIINLVSEESRNQKTITRKPESIVELTGLHSNRLVAPATTALKKFVFILSGN